MNRREFVFSLAAASIRIPSFAPIRIQSITLAPITCRFHKFVAMNSYDTAPKGHTYTNTLVRIATDQGIEGVGVMGYATPDATFLASAKRLVGANPSDLYTMQDGRIMDRAANYADVLARYPHLDGPLCDLIGKIESKPVWQLFGTSVRDRVDAYDGTIYFSDVWFKDRGIRAVVEEVEEAAKRGYRAVKLKVGRGWKWMEKDEGLKRDIDVVHAVRKAVGPDLKVMADANDGFRGDYERAWRFMSETAGDKLHWIEEIFPEYVEGYTRLHTDMRKAGIAALVADGENFQRPEQFQPYLQADRLFDVAQLDIRTGGFVGNVATARMAASVGGFSVPHNWGAHIGVIMCLHLARVTRNIPFIEDDRSTCDVVAPEGYEFSGGSFKMPNTPGLSLRIDEAAYAQKCKPRETVIS